MSVSTALSLLGSAVFLGMGSLSSSTSSSDTQKADFLSQLPNMDVNTTLQQVNPHFNDDSFRVMSNKSCAGVVLGQTYCPPGDLISTSFGNDKVIMSEVSEIELINTPTEIKPATYDSHGHVLTDAVVQWNVVEKQGKAVLRGSDSLYIVDTANPTPSSSNSVDTTHIPPGGDIPTRPQAYDINGVPLHDPTSRAVANIVPIDPIYPAIVIPRHRIPRSLFTLNFVETTPVPQQTVDVRVNVQAGGNGSGNGNRISPATTGTKELPKESLSAIRKEERVIYPKKRLTLIGEFYQTGQTEYGVRSMVDPVTNISYPPIIDYKSREEIIQQLETKSKSLQTLSTVFYGIGGCLAAYGVIDFCIKAAMGRAAWNKK